MLIELSIQEACKNPQNFMYVWADENTFLKYIDQKHAGIIRVKKANQMKLLAISAEKYLGSTDKVTQYYDAIRKAFIEAYDMTPAEALVVLAQGGTVAGKNWSEGVYGIGATNTFYGTNITVRPNDGYFEKNGVLLPGDEDLNVYATVGGKVIVYQRFYEDPETGTVYMSQLNKTTKKYYAASYSNASGNYSAKSGGSINPSDNADLWGAVISSIETFLQWLISLFTDNSKKQISVENTLPSQTEDGFVQGENILESSGLLVAAAAAGLLLFGGVKPSKKKSK